MRKSIKLFLILLLCTLCAAGGFFFGRRTAPDAPTVQEVIGTTFYATINSLDESSMLVTGLDVNSINFQGDYGFSIDEDTALTWNYIEITMADFQVGDRIAVTFTGGIRETAPAGLEKVLRIDLLEHTRNAAPQNAVELP